MKEITDPELLKQLNSPGNIDVENSVELKEVTDPELLKQLNFKELKTRTDLQTSNQKISAQLQQGVDRLNTTALQPGYNNPENTDIVNRMVKSFMKPFVNLKDVPGNVMRDVKYLATQQPVPETSPGFLKQHPTIYNIANKSLEMLSPTIESLAMTPGALTANPMLAGMGYAGAKNLENIANVALGKKEVPSIGENLAESVKNYAMGATMQAVPQGIAAIRNKTIYPDLRQGAIPKGISPIRKETRFPLQEYARIAKTGTPENPTVGFDPGKAGVLYTTNIPISKFDTSRYFERQLAQWKKDAKELNIKTTLSEETQSMPVAQIEKQLRNMLGSSGQFRKHDLENINTLLNLRQRFIDNSGEPSSIQEMGEKIKELVDDHLVNSENMTNEKLNVLRNNILGKFGSNQTYEDLGKSGLASIEEASQFARNRENLLYNNIADRIPKVEQLRKGGVGILGGETELTENPIYAKKLQETAKNLINLIKRREIFVSEDISKTLEDAASGKSFTWDSLEALRRDLRNAIVGINPYKTSSAPGTKFGTVIGQGDNQRVMNKLLSSIGYDQGSFLKDVGNTTGDRSIYKDFLKAREIAKLNRDKFKSIFIQKLIYTESPSKIFDYIQTPENVDNIISAIGKTKFNEVVKPAITNKIMGVGSNDIFNPKTAQRELLKLGETAKKIFSTWELEGIKQTIKDGNINLATHPYNFSFLKLLVNQDKSGQQVMDRIFKAGDGNALNRNIQSIYHILDDQGKQEFKKQLAVELFTKNQPQSEYTRGNAIPELTGWAGNAFKKTLSKYNESVNHIFSKEDVLLLEKIANVSTGLKGAELLAGNPSETARTLTAYSQLNALKSVALTAMGALLYRGATTGGILTGIAEAAGIVGIPYIAAKAFLSDTGKAWIERGMKIPAVPEKMAEWLIQGSLVPTLEPAMKESLIKLAQIYTVNKDNYAGIQSVPNVNMQTMKSDDTKVIQQPGTSTTKLYQDHADEIQLRAKLGNKNMQDYLTKRGLGWGN